MLIIHISNAYSVRDTDKYNIAAMHIVVGSLTPLQNQAELDASG